MKQKVYHLQLRKLIFMSLFHLSDCSIERERDENDSKEFSTNIVNNKCSQVQSSAVQFPILASVQQFFFLSVFFSSCFLLLPLISSFHHGILLLIDIVLFSISFHMIRRVQRSFLILFYHSIVSL